MMLNILVVVGLLEYCTADTEVKNNVMDELLESTKLVLNVGKMDKIDIPDMDNKWQYRWHRIKLTGYSKCHDGVARSLASFNRTDDSILEISGNSATLTTRLTFNNLRIKFEHCRFDAEHLFSRSEDIKVNINYNSFQVQVFIDGQGPQCVASLNHVILDQFDGINVKTSDYIQEQIGEKILKWATAHFTSRIRHIISQKFGDAVSVALRKINLCSKIIL